MNIPAGILLVNKPRGMTSHDVVDLVRRITGIRRIGHTGTLDPLAEGLLVVLIGDATKRQSEFMAGEKEYVAILHLGATSSTDDAEGEIAEVEPPRGGPTSKQQTAAVLRNFIGEIEQMPPAFSAIKIRGRKAYEIARMGGVPKLKPRRVTIREIALLKYRYPSLKLRVVCSSGTYIRALARDIGQTLGCGAYLEALTRTRSGSLLLQDATSLNSLTRENWRRHLVKTESRM